MPCDPNLRLSGETVLSVAAPAGALGAVGGGVAGGGVGGESELGRASAGSGVGVGTCVAGAGVGIPALVSPTGSALAEAWMRRWESQRCGCGRSLPRLRRGCRRRAWGALSRLAAGSVAGVEGLSGGPDGTAVGHRLRGRRRLANPP